MSSLQRYPAQRKSNTFVVIPVHGASAGDLTAPYSNCYLVSENDFSEWKKDNAPVILSSVGNVITISEANFSNAINSTEPNGYWNAKYYTLPNEGIVNIGVTLTDMGKDVFIGVPSEANILHLRLVRAPGNLGKNGVVGYIPIEWNSDIADGGINFPNVSVARVQ